ncbi:MAG: hypothetical protein GY953_23845, partial [bacterium]|nr:hypothetical protein [bacterium]
FSEYKLYYSPTKNPQPLGTVEDLRQHLLRHQIDYVVLMPYGAFRDDMYFQRLFLRLQLDVREAFALVHREQDVRYCVFSVDRERLAQAEPAAALSTR